MASPEKPEQIFSFTDFSILYPDTPHRGDMLDAQFHNLIDASVETIDRLNLIQRDDGRLANRSVYWETLNQSLIDVILEDINPKTPVDTRTTANITLSGEQTLNGVLTATSRVLVKDQNNPAENGIYKSSSGAWTRALDANTWPKLYNAQVLDLHDASVWRSDMEKTGTLGSSPIAFVQTGANQTYAAGAGLTLAGNVFDITNPELVGLMNLPNASYGVPWKNSLGAWTYDPHPHSMNDVIGLEAALAAKAEAVGGAIWAEDFRQDGWTDQQTIQAFFDYLAANGGNGVSTGEYELTEKITCTALKKFRWNHLADFVWTTAATSGGVEIIVGLGVEPPILQGHSVGKLRTEKSGLYRALYLDNYLNINAANIAAKNYGVSNIAYGEISGFNVEGALGAGLSGWDENIVTNCCGKILFQDNFITGLRAAAQMPGSFRGIASIWRDYLSRTITNVTVNPTTGVVTITFSGTAFAPPPGELYVYIDNLGGQLGLWLNGRSFRTDNHTVNTVVLAAYDGRELPAYTGGGLLDQSPSHSGAYFVRNQVNWCRFGIYATQAEGYTLTDNAVIGSYFGYLLETQLSVKWNGFNHANCVFRPVSIRDIGGIWTCGSALIFSRDPGIGDTSVTITKGVTTTGSSPSIQHWFHEGAWVTFPNATGITELDGNYYKLKNVNRTVSPVTFELVDAATGASINSSAWVGAGAVGTMYLVPIHLHIEACRDYSIRDFDFNGVGDMRARGLVIHNCPSAGPNLIENLRMRSGGCYSVVELTGTTDYLEVGNIQNFPSGSVQALVLNQASGLNISYIHRKNFFAPEAVPTADLRPPGVSRVRGGPRAGVRHDKNAVTIYDNLTQGSPSREFDTLNITDPAVAGAGLVILNHNYNTASKTRFMFPDRKARLILPGQTLSKIYDESFGAWVPIVPQRMENVFEVFSDFIGGKGLDEDVSGAGASVARGSYLATTASQTPLGIAKLSTGSTSTGGAMVGEFTSLITPGRGSALFLARVAVEALGNVAQDYVMQAGFFDAFGSGTPANGVYWEHDYVKDNMWGQVARAAGTETRVQSALAVNTNYRYLGIFINGTWGRATFFRSADGKNYVAEATQITTNMPTAALGFGVRIKKRVGATESLVNVDMLGMTFQQLRGLASE
jgi:hypothetical protein